MGQTNSQPVLKSVELPSEEVLNDLQKKRTHIAKEILETERTYVKALEELQEKWYNPLQAEKILSKKELSAIFTTTQQITSLHQQLLGQLEDRINTWDQHKRIADIFIEHAPALSLYTAYVNSYDLSLITLKKCSTNEKFILFARNITHQPIMVVLPNILIQPIQRIPRYTLLLEDLLKKTWVGHPDYPYLQNATDQIRAVAKFINDQKRKYENKQKLSEFQLSFGKAYSIEKNDKQPFHERQFIKEGEITLLKKEKEKKKRFILFDDSIIIYSEASGMMWTGNAKVILFVDLREMIFQPKESGTVQLISGQTSFTLIFNKPEEASKWIQDISNLRASWTELVINNSMLSRGTTNSSLESPQKSSSTPETPNSTPQKNKKEKKEKKKEKEKDKDKAKTIGSKIKKGGKEVIEVAKEVKKDIEQEFKKPPQPPTPSGSQPPTPKKVSENTNLLDEAKQEEKTSCFGCCG